MSFLDSVKKLNNGKKYAILIGCVIILSIFLYYMYSSNTCGSSSGSNISHAHVQYEEEHPTHKEHMGNTESTKHSVQPTYKPPKIEVILYYASWCGYSRSFLPEWEQYEKFAKDNFPNVKVTKIRCEGGDEATCMQKGVQGYPTVIFYLSDGKEVAFNGERTAKELAEFTKKLL